MTFPSFFSSYVPCTPLAVVVQEEKHVAFLLRVRGMVFRLHLLSWVSRCNCILRYGV